MKGDMGRKKAEEENVKKENIPENIVSTFSFLEDINKNYAAFKSKKVTIKVIDSGSPALNDIMNIGGYPRGRVTHIYGPEGSGKSFLCMEAAKNCLRDDPNSFVVWFDAEHSFSYDWAQQMGIWSPDAKKNRMLVLPYTDGVDIFEAIYGKLVKQRMGGTKKTAPGILDKVIDGELNCPLIVIDSIASIITPREKSSPVGSVTVSALAGFLTNELRRISENVEKAKTSLILINQVRESMEEWGDKYHHPGGQNLKHQMSINVYMEKINRQEALILADENDKNTLIGRKVNLTVKKSRFGPAPKTCTTTLLFSKGGEYNDIGVVNPELEILDIAVREGVVKKGGSWYTLPDGQRAQGLKGAQELLNNNNELLSSILKQIEERRGIFSRKGDSIIVEENINQNE